MRPLNRRRRRLELDRLEDRITPTISFTQPTGYYTPSNGMSVATGDFNGDGKIDTVTGNSGGITVYFNDGAGGMINPISMGAGSSFPRAIRVADINGDGKLDVITGNDIGQSLSIFKGNGDGTFQAPVVVTVGGANLQGLAIADFNGDGKLDVATTADNRLAVLLNVGGSNVLGTPTFFAVGTTQLAYGIDSADFDGDGKADIAVAEYNGNQVTTYKGLGNGTFGSPVHYSTGAGSNPSGLIARQANGQPLDFNGDGKVDLAVGYVGNGFVGILLGNGSGGFSSPNTFASGHPRAGRLTAADFDANGTVDLVVQVADGSSLVTQPILTGDGAGGFGTPIEMPFVGDSDVIAADLNGDGLPDLAGSTSFSPGFLGIALNNTAIVAGFSVSAPSSVSVGVPFDVTVTALDSNNATLTNFAGTVHFTSSDGSAVLPADVQFLPSDNGVKTFTVTLKSPLSQTVTVAQAGKPSTATTVSVSVVNHNPTAGDDALSVAQSSSANVMSVLGNDSGAPDLGETLTVSSITQPSHGTATLTAGVIKYTPTPGYAGADAFTYTIGDGNGGTATATVSVTVTSPPPPPNTPPSISNIQDTSVAGGSSTGAIDFVVADADTPNNLTVSATSSDPTLVPSGGFAFGGTGGNRTLTVTPAAGHSGTAVITVTVTDAGGLTASDTFTLTVTSPPNSPPTISNITDRFVVTGGTTGAIIFTVSDAQTPVAGLVVTATSSNTTLVPATGIGLGGTTGSRTILVTPAAGQLGSTVITVTVTDAGGLTASDTFTLTVTASPPPPPPVGTSLAVVANAGGEVVVVDPNTHTQLLDFHPFDTARSHYTGQLSVALGDLNGDGTPELIVATRGNRAGKVKVFDGAEIYAGHVTLPTQTIFTAFPVTGYRRGLTVASADVDGDGLDDLVAAARMDPVRGTAATVVAYTGDDTGADSFIPIGGFAPFTPSFGGGVYVAARSTGTGAAEIAVSSSSSSEVEIWQFDGSTFGQIGGDLSPFLGAAFDNTAGDGQIVAVNTGGTTQFVTGRLSGGVVTLKLLDATGATTNTYTAGSNATFFTIGAIDTDQDGTDEVMVAPVTPTGGTSIDLLNPTLGSAGTPIDGFLSLTGKMTVAGF